MPSYYAKYEPGQHVWPLVRLISGKWYGVDASPVRQILIDKTGVRYNVGGTRYEEEDLAESPEHAVQICTVRNG